LLLLLLLLLLAAGCCCWHGVLCVQVHHWIATVSEKCS
jgi:hypothetical protein